MTRPILLKQLAFRYSGFTASMALLTILAFAGRCHAQGLTFVDASEFVNLTPSTAFNPGGSSIPIDGIGDSLWGFRGTFGANGEIYESSGGTSATATGGLENSPTITQTISGLAAGSYDIYVAYWAQSSADWTIRGGVGGGPMTLFNRTGPETDPNAPTFTALQNAVAGTLAGGVVWASPPLDLSANPIYEEADRVMLLGKVGTATATGGQIDVQIDDLSTAEFPELAVSRYRTWFDGVAYAPAGTVVAPELLINRDTGVVTLQNNTGTPLNVVSYSMTSPAGSFDSTSWSPITGNLDNGGGFDSDPWQINSETAFELGEQEVTINDGGALSITPINFGDVWINSPYTDTQIELTLADSQVMTLAAQYTGTALTFGDFNASGGSLNETDFALMMSNMHETLTTTSLVESHSLGDITGDLAINFDDYREFRTRFDAINGTGSFAAMVAGTNVPEPSTVVLLLVGGILLAAAGGRRRIAACHAILGACVLFVIAAVSPAHAQITYLDATLANTDISTGGPDSSWADGDDGTTGGTVTDGSALNDGLWRYRSGFFNGIWEATGSSAEAEDAAEIVTTANGISSGFYKAYVFWHPVSLPNGAAGTEEFPIRAGFSSNPGANQIFTQVNSEFVQGVVGRDALDSPDSLTFANPGEVPLDSEDRPLLYGEIGIKEVAGGSLPIYIDDLPANPGPEGYSPGALSDLRPWYQGIGYIEAVELTLEINTTTGATKLINNQGIDFDMSYYELHSESGSLNPDGWTSLSADEDGMSHPTPDGVGWDEAGGSTANLLSEGSLDSMETFVPTDEMGLGTAFMSGGTQDVRFYYAAPGGGLTEGIVQYVSSGLAGDHNLDGVVNAADYVFWRDNNINGAQGYSDWRANFGSMSGSGSASSTAVPEPASGLLLVLGGLAAACCRKFRSVRTNLEPASVRAV